MSGSLGTGRPSEPFCWQHKSALRFIRERLRSSGSVASGLSVYVALTEIASDVHQDSFTAKESDIAFRSGVSVRTVRDRMNDLVKIGLLAVEKPKAGVMSRYLLLRDDPGNGCRPTPAMVAGPVGNGCRPANNREERRIERECEGEIPRKGNMPGPGRKPRDLNEAIARGQMIGLDEQGVRDWYRDAEACEWHRGDGTPFDNWVKQMCSYRDFTRANQFQRDTAPRQPGGAKPPSVLDIRTAVQIKEEKAKAIKEKYCTEGPVSSDWSNPQQRLEYFKIRKEIRTLKDKIERMVQ